MVDVSLPHVFFSLYSKPQLLQINLDVRFFYFCFIHFWNFETLAVEVLKEQLVDFYLMHAVVRVDS